MSLTLRDLVADPALRLTTHADAAALERSVSWVHTTELADPTPFLAGGELLLTTGLGLRAQECGDFVDRLTSAGIAGLGFGVGLSHREVPAELTAAVERVGLPLLEVPKETPFIAISKAASRALAAAEYAGLRRTSRAQHELAQAAGRSDGLAALVRKLATLLDAWVLLLAPSGAAMHAAPADSVLHLDQLTTHVDRLRQKKGLAALGMSLGGSEVSMQVLGAHGRGFLIVGRAAGFDTTDHHVINSAASLLTLALEQSATLNAARRRLRSGFLDLMLRGEPVQDSLGDLRAELPAEPLRVVALRGSGDTDALLHRLEVERPRTPLYLAESGGVVVALAAAGGAGLDWLTELPQRYPDLRGGVSEPCAWDGLAAGLRQARQALDSAQRGDRAPRGDEAQRGDRADSGAGRVLRFDEIAGQGLLNLVPQADARAFAESLLAPLLQHDARGDLLASLREWLAQHGQWDPAASRLGVHRHTLRNRMQKVEALLGRAMDQPGARAELWFAVEALGQDR